MRLLMATHSTTAREYILKELQAHVKNGTRAYLVVPEQFTMQTDIRLFEALHVEVLMDIKVKSFSSLSREVLGRLGGLKMPYIHEGGRRMLVQYLLNQHKNDLPLYGKGASQAGISEKIVETLSDYRKLDITEEMLETLLQTEDIPVLLAEKIQEMMTLLKGYSEILGTSHLDNEGRLHLLAKKIPQAIWLKDIDIYLDGFHSLSQVEMEVVKALEKLGARLHISLVLPKAALSNTTGWWTFHSALATSRQFYDSVVQQEMSVTLVDADAMKDTSLPTLNFLTQHVFHYGNVVYDEPTDALEIWKAPYPMMEVQHIAGYIRRLILEEGYQYRDFHITTNQPAVYFPLFERVCRQYQLPVFIDTRQPMSNHYLVQFMVRALEMVASNFAYPVVFSCLKTGLSLMSEEEVVAFDYFAKVKHLRGTMYFDEKYFMLPPETIRSKKLDGLRARHESAWKGFEIFRAVFKPFYDDLQGARTIKEYTTIVYHFMTRPEFLECFYQENDDKNVSQLEIDGQIVEQLVTIFDQLVETIGEMPISLAHFVRILNEGINENSLGILPPAQDEVQVMQLSRARSGRCAIQIIVGMSDVWLPTTQADKTVFMREEKEWLGKNGLDMPSSENRIIEDEALCLYECMAKPIKQLILSYSLSGQDHSPMNESIFIRRTKEIFPMLEEKSVLASFDKVRPYLEWESLKYTMEWMRRYGKMTELSDEQKAHCREIMSYYAYFNAQRVELTQFLERGLHYHNVREKLIASVSKKIYPGLREGRVSISELETWQRCPYKHFIQYGIRPEEEVDYTLQTDETGTLLHGSLSRLTHDISLHPEWIELDDEKIYAQMDVYLEEESQRYLEHQRLTEGQNRMIIKKLQRQSHKAGKYILKQLGESRFQPKFYEAKFGDEKAIFPPIILECEGEYIRVEGRIDRIDVWQHDAATYVRVIDYKSGNKEFNLENAFAGLDMQLLLYLRAVLGWEKTPMPAGVFYLSMKELFINLETTNPEEIEKEFVNKLLMDGVFIDDPAVVEALDKSAKTGKHTVIRRTGRGTKSAPDNQVSTKVLNGLLEHVIEVATDSVKAVLDGDIRVMPVNGNCQFCAYLGACRFENRRNGNQERVVEKMNWKMLKSYLGEEG